MDVVLIKKCMTCFPFKYFQNYFHNRLLGKQVQVILTQCGKYHINICYIKFPNGQFTPVETLVPIITNLIFTLYFSTILLCQSKHVIWWMIRQHMKTFKLILTLLGIIRINLSGRKSANQNKLPRQDNCQEMRQENPLIGKYALLEFQCHMDHSSNHEMGMHAISPLYAHLPTMS